MSRQLRVDRFGDTWTVETGPAAREIRRQILAEQDELPAVTMTWEEVEAEVGRRLALPAARAALPGSAPSPVSRSRPSGRLSTNARKDAA